MRKPKRFKSKYSIQYTEEQPFRSDLFNIDQLTQHAEILAANQQLVGGSHNDYLPERLNYNDAILHNFNNSSLLLIKTKYITPATEWLVDNFYLIEEHIQLARRHFPKQYNRELPCLMKGPCKGLPRVYSLAIELISHVDAEIDEESLFAFFKAYQSESILKLGELWAVPIMLRLALIENAQRIAKRLELDQIHRDLANKWVDKLEAVAAKKASQLVEVISDMAKSGIPLSSSFISEFCQRLSSQNSALQIARGWLEQRLVEEGLTIEELLHAESQNQAASQLSVSHTIQSLRFLNSTDWKIFVETLSKVEHIFQKDPIGTYSLMDFATRDHYRHVVESLAQRCSFTEVEIAQQALLLAHNAQKQELDQRHAHIGFYLVGEGRSCLMKAIGIKKTRSAFRQVLNRFPLSVYLYSIAFFTLLGTLFFVYIMTSADVSLFNWQFILLSFCFSILMSQSSLSLVNWLSMLFVKPDILPRLDFSDGIASDCRTMVAIPTMISNEESIDKLIANLELHYLSNRNHFLHFGLLTDFTDALHEKEENDDSLLERVRLGIEQLNKQYTTENHPLFYLFHRPRRWNPKENIWMGYERKRGKLMEFNAFLKGEGSECFSLVEGDISVLNTVKYVITLDSDTQLPPDTAYKLIGTMAHPLNKPEFDPVRNIVVKGYGILQPRVAANLSSSQSSLFSQLFTNDAGIDPYTRAVSDVYQDLFHEGSFIGKGIYDVDAFEQALAHRFPENKILSHDLIESTYVRSALVTDVEIYESYPSSYLMDIKRRHRWIRGDWQIIQWIFPRIPSADNTLTTNPLSGLGKWKIFDNLRRSLIHPITLLFLIGFYLIFPEKIGIGLAFILTLILLPFVCSVLTSALRKPLDQSWVLHIKEVCRQSMHQLKQILFSIVMLPFEAYLNTDAIIRTLWRLLISHKNLLRWQASADADRMTSHTLSAFSRKIWFSPALALTSTLFLGIYNPYILCIIPFLCIWLLAPYIAWFVSCPIRQKASTITKEQERMLHRIARKTWHFFEVFVNKDENWLPPDNFQEAPVPKVASRTSPTNIGVSLLANLAAFDFGYIPGGKVVERTQQTFQTLTSLKKFKGHLYNWYDTRTLEPLFPLYVSSVDSGNLAGHLLTLGQGLKEMAASPLFSSIWMEGLLDTTQVLKELDKKNPLLKQFEKELSQIPPQTLHASYDLLNNTLQKINYIDRSLVSDHSEIQAWVQLLQQCCQEHLDELVFLAPWVTLSYMPFLEKLEEKISEERFNQITSLLNKLDSIPVLNETVNLENEISIFIQSIIDTLTEDGENSDKVEIEYFETYLACFKKAEKHTKQRIDILNVLAFQSEGFAKMDFEFLYNPVKNLFSIGYNATENRIDSGSYDMLASEARLCSYVAISQGQVPLEHWFSLGRLLILRKGKPILLSWSGSMFEYLMPLLVMPDFEQTLLHQTYKGVLEEQIEYAGNFNVPWGISESGLNRTDTYFNYQYKAFGIPSLGLKRGLSEDLVIAPYATVLALMVDPKKASENMQRLSTEGHESIFGYYEAIDYTPAHLPPDETSTQVRSFMAHHQGMSLLALINVLKKNVMQQRFISCPTHKAFELLLQEHIPHSITAHAISDDSKFEIEGLHPLLSDNVKVNRVFKDMPIAPEVNLLSNGRYKVLISNTGAGFSQWNNLAITRWREDATCDDWGLFIYLRDIDAGTFWSVGYQPTHFYTKKYEVKFTQAYAEFQQQHLELDIQTNICVSPEDDVELRRITLSNHSNKPRTIELTTYSEAVIAPQAHDEAHPAFSNLFVQTQFNPALSSLFCTRRARSEEEIPPHVFHLIVLPKDQKNDISCETDRSRFIGRGNSSVFPLAMQTTGPLSGSVGSVLDPVLSLRRTVTIPPGKTIEVCIVLGISETESGALALADKYQNTRMTERAFELAWTHSQVALYQLNITESEAQLFAKMVGALVYMNPIYRPESSIIKNNRRAQNSLWGYSISGDMPLVLLRIRNQASIELVRQLVLAHAYWHMKGLTVELVLLNEDTSVYRQSLHDEIISLISNGIEAPLLEKPGGIFVRRVEQMPREDILLLQSVARIVLDDEHGTLFDQIENKTSSESKTPLLQPTRLIPIVSEAKVPESELIFANGLGGFTPNGDEYVITLQHGQSTPAPWCNVLANENFGTVVSESGGAYTWAKNAHEFRLTPWNNDTIRDVSGEAFYIRDEQTGQYWSPTPSPARGETAYVIRHGFGYTVFEHSENEIDSELWIYVALDHSVKFSILTLRNTSKIPRRLSVTGYYEWILADNRSKSHLHIQTEVDIETGVLFARNFYNSDFSGQIAFIDVGEPRTVTGDRKEFIGQNNNLSKPEAMKRKRLSGKTGAGMDACGAVQVVFDLAEGEEKETRFRLGYAYNKAEMKQLVLQYRKIGVSQEVLDNIRTYWKRILGTIQVDTPDLSVNVMTNGWLLYQTLSSRIWARSGFYQSGGGYGFRDQLQDVMALFHTEPAISRKQILRAAAHQFKKGDVMHWWHPPMDRGVRTHFSDDYLWLPYVTARYISSVGDIEILNEKIHFLEGRELRPDEESYYDQPSHSEESGTLYEHCVRSINYGLKFGSHGLPLMGCGDWNDGMNLVGKDGKGESVWLAFFLYDVLMKFAEVAGSYKDESYAQYCVQMAKSLHKNIQKHAWDGKWYRRAYFDNGEPLGSIQNAECQIDSIPQSWAVISGAGDKEYVATAMEQVDIQLVDKKANLIRLFSPPFDHSPLNPGYIKGYVPGVRENGGQYTHAAIWTIWASALIGNTNKAWEFFDLINPVHHGSTPEQIAIYKVEPYVVAADVYAATQHVGRGGWTWYTGSSAWMYCVLIETLLGVKRLGNSLHLSAHFKQEWEQYQVHYRFGETLYHITFHKIQDQLLSRLLLDGNIQADTHSILMTDDQQEHFVEIYSI